MPRYAVTRSPGSGYDRTLPIREQAAFAEHADFMDGLAVAGVVVMAGLLESGDALVVIDATSADDARAVLDPDPWTPLDVLPVTAVVEWRTAVVAPALRGGIVMLPVARVVGGRSEPTDDDWGTVEAAIVLDDRFAGDVLAGLEGFSHLDVVFVFDRVDESAIHLGARHPRNRSDWPLVGIFAQRAKARPNRIGVTTCELLGVDDRTVRVRGLDAIDGTPVLDLKPHVREFGPRGPVEQPEWMTELMSGYW